jgi:hypothetical protein
MTDRAHAESREDRHAVLARISTLVVIGLVVLMQPLLVPASAGEGRAASSDLEQRVALALLRARDGLMPRELELGAVRRAGRVSLDRVIVAFLTRDALESHPGRARKERRQIVKVQDLLSEQARASVGRVDPSVSKARARRAQSRRPLPRREDRIRIRVLEP